MGTIIFIGRCISVVLFLYSVFMFALMFKSDDVIDPNVRRRIYTFLFFSFVGMFFPVVLVLLLVLELGFFKRYLFCRKKREKICNSKWCLYYDTDLYCSRMERLFIADKDNDND